MTTPARKPKTKTNGEILDAAPPANVQVDRLVLGSTARPRNSRGAHFHREGAA